ncbi:enoyl-CoA hydratase/carnithine racemase [Bradyrhizobium elkanii]
MNRPSATLSLVNSAPCDFIAACERINDDDGVRCVILTGNGPSFSAGGDINEMRRQATSEVGEMRIPDQYRRGIQRLALTFFNLECR